MLASLGGSLALILGLAILLLPLVAGELSRPGDSAWGAVLLLLGLVLVTTAERLTGAPMLAVLCGALLIGRLGREVGQARWRQLTMEEQQLLVTPGRWMTSLGQVGSSLGKLVEKTGGIGASLVKSRTAPITTKRWVRPDQAVSREEGNEGADPDLDSDLKVVSDFGAIDELLRDASSGSPGEARSDEAG